MGRWPPGNHRLLGLRFKPIFLPTYRKQLHKAYSFTQAQTQQKVWILFKRCIYFASNYIGIYSSIFNHQITLSKQKKKKKVSFFPHFTTFRLITLLQSHSQPWRHIHMCTGSRWRFGFCRAQTAGGRRTACTENSSSGNIIADDSTESCFCSQSVGTWPATSRRRVHKS